MSAGESGPSSSSQRSSSASEWRASARSWFWSRPNFSGSPRPGHREPPHPDPVDPFLVGRNGVLPGDVIDGLGRQDFDLGVFLQVLGDPAAVELGAAVDLETVALDDQGQLHSRTSCSRAFSRFPRKSKSFSMIRVLALRVSFSILSLRQLDDQVVGEVWRSLVYSRSRSSRTTALWRSRSVASYRRSSRMLVLWRIRTVCWNSS